MGATQTTLIPDTHSIPVQTTEDIMLLVDKYVREQSTAAMSLGVLIGTADSFLYDRNRRSHTEHEQLMCGAYGWLIATIECRILLNIGIDADETFQTIIDQKKRILRTNDTIDTIQQLMVERVQEHQPFTGDNVSAMRELSSANSVIAIRIALGHVLDTMLNSQCNMLFKTVLELVIVHIRHGDDVFMGRDTYM